MSILFCKIFDEFDTAPDDLPRFRTGLDEDATSVKSRISEIFIDVRAQHGDVFSPGDEISLDPASIQYVVGELQNYEITSASRDAIGDAFEVFVGPAVRGEEGQFFTPRNVVERMIDLVNPQLGERIIDPACGSGGFLTVALQHLWQSIEAQATQKGWSETQLERARHEAATRSIYGVDKDSYLTKIAKAYMALIGDGRGGIHCDDSLADPVMWQPSTSSNIRLGTFDVVITNPPFGSKIKVTGHQKLRQYDLARVWKQPRQLDDDWQPTSGLRKDQSPQILFIERCIQLLKPRGRLAIVLPESLFGVPSYGYVAQYIFNRFKVRAFVSLPEEVFQPYTHAKTCIVVLENRPPDDDDVIEMAIADWCGHDSRGKPTVRRSTDGVEEVLDDLPRIGAELRGRLTW